MLTKAQVKYIRSLVQVKARKENNVFFAEGHKIVVEWLQSNWQITWIVATEKWINLNNILIKKHPEALIFIVNESVLASLSALQTPNQVIIVVQIPNNKPFDFQDEWYLALDGIQDPGNMGTILRIADWFGIKQVFCSPDSVDTYNPKVIQAAMGAHLRVNIKEENLDSFLPTIPIPKYAAVLNGINVYNIEKSVPSVIIIGNESKGISEQVLRIASTRISIPKRGGAESLNASVATGILCAFLIR